MRSLLLILVCCTYAVSVNATYTDSIRQYYHYVLEAEHCSIQRDLKRAAELYDKAFKLKQPFATDIYNRLLCAADLKDDQAALACCEALVKKGAPLAFFSQSVLANFRKSVEYTQLEYWYDEWYKEYLSSTNQPLIAYLKKLVAADQSIHCALPVNYEDTAFVNHMHNNDDSLSIIISDLMIKNNYLGEEVTGAVFQNDTTLSSSPLHGVVLLHQIQRGGDILTNAIMEAMKRGKLRSELGITWLSHNMKAKLDLTRCYNIYNDTLRKLKETKEDAAMFKKISGQTDEIRKKIMKEIYLDSEYFDVEERVVYNFYSRCEECTIDIYKSFSIAPWAMTTYSFEPGQEAMVLEIIYSRYEVLAHK